MESENLQEVPEVQKEEIPKVLEAPVIKPLIKKIVKLVKKVKKGALEKQESTEGLEESSDNIELSKEVKTKKPRTQAQIDSFKRCLEIKKANALKRRTEMDIIADQQQRELEKKILKKALAIKKREIRSKIALESIQDDDEPVDSVLAKVKAIQSKPVKPVVPPTPQYIFM